MVPQASGLLYHPALKIVSRKLSKEFYHFLMLSFFTLILLMYILPRGIHNLQSHLLYIQAACQPEQINSLMELIHEIFNLSQAKQTNHHIVTCHGLQENLNHNENLLKWLQHYFQLNHFQMDQACAHSLSSSRQKNFYGIPIQQHSSMLLYSIHQACDFPKHSLQSKTKENHLVQYSGKFFLRNLQNIYSRYTSIQNQKKDSQAQGLYFNKYKHFLSRHGQEVSIQVKELCQLDNLFKDRYLKLRCQHNIFEIFYKNIFPSNLETYHFSLD